MDGRVCVVAEGPKEQVESLLRRLWALEPATYDRPGKVKTIIEQWGEPKGERRFDVR